MKKQEKKMFTFRLPIEPVKALRKKNFNLSELIQDSIAQTIESKMCPTCNRTFKLKK